MTIRESESFTLSEQATQQQTTQLRLRLQIPAKHHQEPILWQLADRYCLRFNILSALLDARASGGGWFDLQVQGGATEIDAAVAYLVDSGVVLWQPDQAQFDGW